MKEDAILQEIQRRLSRHFHIHRVVLFGSRATGEEHPESDWDVLVVADSSIPFVERQGKAMVALGPHDFPVDLLLYTPAEAEEAAAIPGTAVYWAQSKGKVVYAR